MRVGRVGSRQRKCVTLSGYESDQAAFRGIGAGLAELHRVLSWLSRISCEPAYYGALS